MPYCNKCGAKLNEGANFCPVCGNAVGARVAQPEPRRVERRLSTSLALFIIFIIAAAVVSLAFAVAPIRFMDVSETRDVPYRVNVDVLNLRFTADVGRVQVGFEDLSGKLVSLQVSVTGYGNLITSKLYALSFDYSYAGNVLTVTSEIDTRPSRMWGGLSRMNASYRLLIHRTLRTSLEVKTTTGETLLSTRAGVVLNALSLEATTGRVEASLLEGVVVAGDVSLKAVTGGVALYWDNLVVTKSVLVNLRTTTGGVDAHITQDEGLRRNVTVNAETTTGSVDLTLRIRGDVGARIESSFVTGSINIDNRVGFSGLKNQLQSTNYPDDGNFDLTLRTTTGAIRIDTGYTV